MEVISKIMASKNASVYLGYYENKQVIFKFIKKGYENERKILVRISNLNITPKLYLYDDTKKLIVNEYKSGNNLLYFINNNIDKKEYKLFCKKIFKSIICLVQKLHYTSIYHLDLKPENIVLDNNIEPYLIDFGHAICGISTNQVYLNKNIGTRQYRSPEAVILGYFNLEKYDIWCLGVLLYEMLTNNQLFPRGYQEIKLQKLNRLETDERDLIEKMLNINFEKRPNLKNILEHPYLHS